MADREEKYREEDDVLRVSRFVSPQPAPHAMTDVVARLRKVLAEPFPREEIDLDDVRALLAQPAAVEPATDWKQQVRELCAVLVTRGWDMTPAMEKCWMEATGNGNKYPNPIDALARAALAAPSPAVAEPARKAIFAQGTEVQSILEALSMLAPTDTSLRAPTLIDGLAWRAKRALASPLPAATLGKTDKSNMKDRIRSIFMRHGFTIKDGHDDLKDYVYAAAFELLAQQPAASDVRDAERLDWAIRDVFDGADKLVCALHDEDGFPIRFEDARGAIDIARQSTPAVHATTPLTLENAPIGTEAPAYGGGCWTRTSRGWQWGKTGGTFPNPGADWNGELITPAVHAGKGES